MLNEHSTFFKKWNTLTAFLLLAIFGFLVYANTLQGDFIWDDEGLVQDNLAIRDLSKVFNFFTQDMGGGEHEDGYGFYRPLTMATYSIDYALGKLNVVRYHFTNIFLHILAAFSIYLAVTLLCKDSVVALFTGVLFILFPGHTEAVAYISGRSDPLAAIGVVLGFVFYLKYLESGRKFFQWLVVVMYALALLSKENSIMFPVLLLLYHYAFKKDLKIRALLPVFALTGLYLFLRFAVLKSSLPHTEITQWMFLLRRVPGFFVAIAHYIRILFLPFNLHYEYGNALFRWYDYRALLGAGLFLFLILYAFSRRNKDALVFFSICWFFITLLPTSSIYPIAAFYMAEHWLYLPSVGFFLIIARWLTGIYRTDRLKMVALFFVVGISLAYSYLTIEQNNYWKDPVSFYKRTLLYAPWSQRVYYNLGCTYLRLGRYTEAIAANKKAIEINPKNCKAHNSLANAYYYSGDYPEAIAVYKKAIEMDVKNYKAYNNLAVVYNSVGKNPEAIEMYKKAIEIKPDYAQAHANLAETYFETQQYDLAIQHCNKALALGYKVAPAFLE